MPVVVEGPAGVHVMGTAVMLTPGLALTARHVVDECLQLHNGIPPGEPGARQQLSAGFHVRLFQFLDQGRSGLVWRGRRIHTSAYTDIAFIELLKPDGARPTPSPVMTALPPDAGSQVFAFGYPRSVVDEDKITLDPRTTSGAVLEVFERGRDRCLLPHSSFHTDAVFDAGVSGGPVFNSSGHLCGIVSSSVPPDDDGPWSSFASLLWLAFATRLYMARADLPDASVGYPALDLVRAGFLHLKGWERIVVEPGDRPGLRMP